MSKNDLKISELVLSNKNLSTVKKMAENIPGGFFVYKDTEMAEVIFVNHMVLELYGCSTLEEFKEHTGFTFNGMVHPEDIIKIQSSIDFQIERSDDNFDYVEYRIIRRDGSVRYVEDFGHFEMTEDFGPIYYVFIADITDKYKTGISKNSYLYSLAHDLQIPMNELNLYIEQLNSNIDKKDLRESTLESINASLQFLNGTMSQLIELSEMRSGNIKVKEVICRLNEEGAKLKNLGERLNGAKKQIYKFAMPEDRVIMDPELFGRIIGNLLSNAIKYTPDGGKIEVSGKLLKKSENGYGRYRFVVADSGIGMSQEFLDKTFNVYEQNYMHKDADISGAGLGLYMVKRTVHVLGGSIKATSVMGKGTKVIIELPLKMLDVPEVYNDLTDISMPDGCRGRIIVAGCKDKEKKTVVNALSGAGYLVECVKDGTELVDAIRNHRANYYNLVLTGISMPVMKGYEAIYKIRETDRSDAKMLPIYAICDFDDTESRLNAAESGATGFISKPVDGAGLVAIVDAASLIV